GLYSFRRLAMKPGGGPKPDRGLTAETFEALLRALAPDRMSAAIRYETLRRKLIRFFEWERSLAAEDRADEVLTRFARRVAGGEVVASPDSYCYAIARLVLREEQAARVRQAAAIDTMRGQPQTSAAAEAMTRCFGECLGRLSPAQRELLLAYYEGEKSQRIEN